MHFGRSFTKQQCFGCMNIFQNNTVINIVCKLRNCENDEFMDITVHVQSIGMGANA